LYPHIIEYYYRCHIQSAEYLEAYQQMLSNQVISHPDILSMPATKQQFMTIGLIQKLANAAFPKLGLIVEEIDYLLYKAASAFSSHSLAIINEASCLQAEPSG
jgi:hypothetical protein